jgi:uncharacterized damage-inducible protein DinB
MEDFERRRFFETLAATPQALKASLKGLSKKVLLWTPAPGKWSILEILCHMRDMEREAYIERYTRILSENEPALPNLEGEALAILRAYRSQKAPEVVREWVALRRQTLQLLRKAGKAQWARAGIHATAGRLTMEDLIRRHAVGNDEAHLRQIEAIKRRFAVLERLAAAPVALAAALKGAPLDVVKAKGAGGRWSMIENAAHVRDIERVYQGRFSQMAFGDRPAFWMLDNDRAAEALKYADADPAEVAKEFRRLREDSIALLRALPHEAWQKTGVHPEAGEITVEQLAVRLADHDDKHLGKIRALRG